MADRSGETTETLGSGRVDPWASHRPDTAILRRALSMRRHVALTRPDAQVNRRGFLTVPGLVSAITLLGGIAAGRLAYAAALTKEQRDQLTPDDIPRPWS